MITFLYECFLLGIVGALVGIFYNYTLNNGAIFSSLADILTGWAYCKGFKGWIANPLGACIYCSTTWITIFIMVFYWLSWCEPPRIYDIIMGTLAAIGVQHIIIRIYSIIIAHSLE